MDWDDNDDDDDNDDIFGKRAKREIKEDKTDEEDFVDALFKKVELESKQMIEKLTANRKSNLGITATSSANVLKLREVCLLKKWDRVVEKDVLEKVKTEQNVIRTHYLTQAELEVPYELRETTTSRFFLYTLKQEGLFSDVYNIEVFTLEMTGQQLLLCSTVSRRVDEHRLLTGNYVFQLVDTNKKWNGDNIDSKTRFSDGVCKVRFDGPSILAEKVIFRNFYFDLVDHSARDPLLSLNFL